MTKENKTIRIEEYPSFGYWLKRRRKALDLTQAELARRAGCSAATIRKIEADERKPSTQLAELLAEQLQLPDDQIETFVQFARGVAVGDQTGLEAPGDGRRVGPALDDPGARVAHNLPAQTTPFFGRAAELAALAGFLSDPQKRLVTVLGPGGMGKTRLALAAAEERLNSPDSTQRFGDGIYFVPLAGVGSADSLVSAVADALDFQFSGADEPQAQLLRYLGGRQLLLVLDNFEHLLSGVGLAQAILDDCPGVELLVTSREKLKLQAEQLLPIGGLSYPAEDEAIALELPGNYSAVQLFEERVRSVRPSFELSDDNLKAITAICRQVEGMPLGIVLAAAWIDTLTAAEIAREIGRDLDFLETELSDVPARQHSLHAAFNSYWRLLSSEEKEIYCQLSVFRGGFTAEAANAVAGASLRDLQMLVNKSLLSRSAAGGQSAHYLALLQRHEPRWHTGRQLETLASIARESDNISAAWRLALAAGDWEHLAGAIDSWGQYHLWQGLFSDGNALCVALESRLKDVMGPPVTTSFACITLWVKALAWQGVFLSTTEDALAKLEECLAFLEGQDPETRQIRRLKAFVLRQMAWRLIPVATKKAHHKAEQALQFSLQLNDRWQAAESHYYLSLLNWKLARLVEARESTEISLAVFREMGDRRMQVASEIILAWITQVEGDFELAERLRNEALDLCRRIGDRPFLIHCTGDLAYTLIYRGKMAEGLHSAEECVALSMEYGFKEKEGWARMLHGYSLLHLGHYDDAQREVERALALVQETGNQDVETGAWSTRGYLALVRGDSRRAGTYYEKGYRLSIQIEDEIFLGDKIGGLLLAACQGDAGDKARKYAVTYLEYVIRTRNFRQLIEALPAVAYYLAFFGSKQKALAIWQQASSQPFVAASKWYKDVIGREIEARTADLSPLPDVGSTKHDLWTTAESLLADLA